MDVFADRKELEEILHKIPLEMFRGFLAGSMTQKTIDTVLESIDTLGGFLAASGEEFQAMRYVGKKKVDGLLCLQQEIGKCMESMTLETQGVSQDTAAFVQGLLGRLMNADQQSASAQAAGLLQKKPIQFGNVKNMSTDGLANEVFVYMTDVLEGHPGISRRRLEASGAYVILEAAIIALPVGVMDFGEQAADIVGNREFRKVLFRTEPFRKGMARWLEVATDTEWPSSADIIQESLERIFPAEWILDMGVQEQLDQAVESGLVDLMPEGYWRHRPDILEVLTQDEGIGWRSDNVSRDKRMIRAVLGGKPAAQAGQEEGLTRQRASQIIECFFKHVKDVDAVRYRNVFEEYDIGEQDMVAAFDILPQTYQYLKLRYKKGERSAKEALVDDSIPRSYRKRLRKSLYRSYIKLDGTYVKARRHDLLEYFLEKFCQEDITVADFQKKYEYLLMLLGREDEEKLHIEDRYYTATLPMSHKLLWKQGQVLRYYEVDRVDIDELLRDMHVDEYQDVEVSAQLFLDKYPALREQYDLRDCYELHNLLKKRLSPELCEKYQLGFGRMPMLRFGEADTESQVLDLLQEKGTIKQEAFAEAYREMYGVASDTFKANLAKYIRQYRHGDSYTVDVKKLSQDELAELSSVLKRSFYSIGEMKGIFRKLFPDKHGYLNHYNMEQLGYRWNEQTIYRTDFPSVKAAMEAQFRQEGIFGLSGDRGAAMRSYGVFYNYLNAFQHDLEVIEFAPAQFIHITKLESVGVTKDELLAAADEVKQFAKDDYFTMYSLRKAGMKLSLDRLGFEDDFVDSILWASDAFQVFRMGGVQVYASLNAKGTFAGALEYLLEREGSVDLDDLMDMLRMDYGICLPNTFHVLDNIRRGDNELYYNDIRRRVYRDYETYYAEV
ncbi:hypothetical protein SAMN02910356_01596 [Selenomonas sp. GACV-9]|uniref:hypothetical protein n=1 Tax=Selenomonas sp. GACV-9 TaxID=3158782 RepID=UPI0008E679BD|nr:hypothetical protein SAMN02910356_01596 [Selenomonas ruminantium]